MNLFTISGSGGFANVEEAPPSSEEEEGIEGGEVKGIPYGVKPQKRIKSEKKKKKGSSNSSYSYSPPKNKKKKTKKRTKRLEYVYIDYNGPDFRKESFGIYNKKQGVYVGSSSCKGYRETNEDESNVFLNQKTGVKVKSKFFNYFAIFDGHAGCMCSSFVGKALNRNFLVHHLENKIVGNKKELFSDQTILDVFKQTETEFRQYARGTLSGSCCVQVVIMKESDEFNIIITNLGDSQALVNENGEITFESVPHDTQNEEERELIEKRGGKIIGNRVNGTHAITRSFGDFRLKIPKKEVISAVPDIKRIKVKSGRDQLDFVLIFCDGLVESPNVNSETTCFLVKVLIEAQLNGDYLATKYAYLNQWIRENMNEFDMQRSKLIKSLKAEFLQIVDYHTNGINLGLITNDLINYTIFNKSLDNVSVILVSLNGIPETVEKAGEKEYSLGELEQFITDQIQSLQDLIENGETIDDDENQNEKDKEVPSRTESIEKSDESEEKGESEVPQKEETQVEIEIKEESEEKEVKEEPKEDEIEPEKVEEKKEEGESEEKKE